MLKKTMVAAFMFGALALVGCKGPTYNSGYGQHVNYTPVYQENKVYWAGAVETDPDSYKNSVRLLPDFVMEQNASDEKSDYVSHGEPLTVVLSSAVLPTRLAGKGGKRDMAVIVDMTTAADGKNTSLLVWYQRGLRADQALNFSNLIIHYEPKWDSRMSPKFRVRLMHVAMESNEETQFILSEAGKYGSTVVQMAQIPLAQPVVELAAKAASTLLGNQKNELYLDYTVQFYSQDHLRNSGGAGLGQLKRGKFIVLGRPQFEDLGEAVAEGESARKFWLQDMHYNRVTEMVATDANMDKEVVSPFISLTLVTSESIVPLDVLERSAYLSKYLFDPDKASDLQRIQNESDELHKSVTAFTKRTAFLIHRNADTFRELVRYAVDATSPITSDDRNALLHDINGWIDIPQPDIKKLGEWLEENETNIESVDRETMKITLKPQQAESQ